MAVLLVLLQIKDGQKRDEMRSTLERGYRLCAQLTESAYAIQTTLPPIRVFDQLKQYVGSDDRLYVIPLARPYTGYAPRGVTEWLSDFLPP